jgi:hypothetical protein
MLSLTGRTQSFATGRVDRNRLRDDNYRQPVFFRDGRNVRSRVGGCQVAHGTPFIGGNDPVNRHHAHGQFADFS